MRVRRIPFEHTDITSRGLKTGTPLIEGRGLSLGYRSGPDILAGIDAEVRSGEVMCVIGPNGGGKTTLLRALAGLLRPRQGTVRLLGRSLYGRRSLDRRERAQMLAVVLTHTTAPAYLRVSELVELGRLPYRRSRERDIAIVARALEESGVSHLWNRPVGELSDGEAQRVMVARALAQEPRILLLDEPAVHLDPPHQSELFLLLRSLVAEETIDSVAVATHHLHLAVHFSDRILVVADGTVIDGIAPTLLAEGTIERAFAGDRSRDRSRTGSELRLDPERGWFVPTDNGRGVW
ncbi:MAG: ABC transporter ATP-binding protein [Alkalispirochaeta sp.]